MQCNRARGVACAVNFENLLTTGDRGTYVAIADARDKNGITISQTTWHIVWLLFSKIHDCDDPQFQ